MAFKVSVVVLLLVAVFFTRMFDSSPVQREKPESRISLEARSFEKRDCHKHLQYHTGFSCFAYMERYKWSDKQQECILAIYGGCQPTKNNFITLEECRKVAAPICKKTS